MLAIINIPGYIEDIYSEYKALAKDIYDSIQDSGEEKLIPGRTDLFNAFPDGTVIHITDGFFRFKNGEKLMRLYSQTDFVVVRNFHDETTLASDFGSSVMVFDKDVFLNILHQDAAILEKWVRLQDIENSINRYLATVYMKDNEISPDFNLKEYKAGDIIANEGEPPLEIYEMITGSAVAVHEGKEIGMIHEGEIFGEISFLTESSRSATVKASEDCIVNAIKKEQFDDLIKFNPQLILSISKTLARRIVTLNDIVAGKIT